MGTKIIQTEVLTETIDGSPYYGVLEIFEESGRLQYRVHYGCDVRRGKDDNWKQTSDDFQNIRALASGLLGEMIDANPRA